MFEELFKKLNDFEDHHQVLFALIVTLGIVCFSWGVEKLLDEYVFPQKPIYGYLIAIAFGLFLIWICKHVILRVW
jgi:hypothetical protein